MISISCDQRRCINWNQWHCNDEGNKSYHFVEIKDGKCVSFKHDGLTIRKKKEIEESGEEKLYCKNCCHCIGWYDYTESMGNEDQYYCSQTRSYVDPYAHHYDDSIKPYFCLCGMFKEGRPDDSQIKKYHEDFKLKMESKKSEEI